MCTCVRHSYKNSKTLLEVYYLVVWMCACRYVFSVFSIIIEVAIAFAAVMQTGAEQMFSMRWRIKEGGSEVGVRPTVER